MNLDPVNIIQWLSVFGSLGGMTLVTLKIRIGFALWVISSVGWIIVFINTGIYPRLVVEIIYAIQAAFGFFWWKKSERS